MTSVEENNKSLWNSTRSKTRADFYTLGYSGRTLVDITKSLLDCHVATLVDIRANPSSQHRPQFNKRSLSREFSTCGIQYVHRPDLGIPKVVRALIKDDNIDSIWEWYDEYVIPKFIDSELKNYRGLARHPLAFMCTEYDPFSCHRHRLALALEDKGLKSFDL
jgi:uncharacterized protein (DUF488 family)